MVRRAPCAALLAFLLHAAPAHAVVGGHQVRSLPSKSVESSSHSGKKQDARKPHKLYFKPAKKTRRAFA